MYNDYLINNVSVCLPLLAILCIYVYIVIVFIHFDRKLFAIFLNRF